MESAAQIKAGAAQELGAFAVEGDMNIEKVSLARSLSNEYGPGSSAYSLENLRAWRLVGSQAEARVQAHDWLEADRLAVSFCDLRPDWPNGYVLRQRTMMKLGRTECDVLEMLQLGASRCEAAHGCHKLRDALSRIERSGEHCSEKEPEKGPVKYSSPVKGLKLLPHELELVEAGELEDITHAGASAIWLSTGNATITNELFTTVYRPMGDLECGHLLQQGVLPDTQPYQTIVEGDGGRVYAEKYLRGHKSVDSSPTTVVEFIAPRSLIDRLFQMQSKNEDGAISHGLGDKGGRGLPLFNASLLNNETTFRIVFVKRFAKKAVGAFGASRRKC